MNNMCRILSGKDRRMPGSNRKTATNFDQVLEMEGYRKERHIGGRYSRILITDRRIKIKQRYYFTKMGID